MKFFPSGAGAISLGISFLFLVLTIIFNHLQIKAVKYLCLILMLPGLLYMFIGSVVLFRSPYRVEGSGYYSSGIDAAQLKQFLTANNTVDLISARLAPDAAGYYYNQATDSGGRDCTDDYRVMILNDSRIHFKIYFYNDDASAKAAYTDAAAAYSSGMSTAYLIESRGYCAVDLGKSAACIYPVTYDGIKFILPKSASDGAYFAAFFYCGSCYVAITESASKIDQLALPSCIQNNTQLTTQVPTTDPPTTQTTSSGESSSQ